MKKWFSKTFEWRTTFKPTEDQIWVEQRQRGYHPNGYGGPFDVKIVQTTNNEYLTTWSCFNTCD